MPETQNNISNSLRGILDALQCTERLAERLAERLMVRKRY